MGKLNRRLRWPALVVALALVAVILSWLRGRSSSHEHAAAPPPKPAVVDRLAAPASRTRSAPNLEVAPPRPMFSAVRLPPMMQRVLDDNPDLAQYYGLEQKVVPTAEERGNLHAMLSDLELIETIKEYLLAAETAYSKDAEAKRMVAVEFLSDAINWADNPARPAVLTAIEGVMFADNITADAPEDLAQSLAGDKVELYMQMLHRSPDRAAVVSAHARGSSVQPLLTYAKESYDREMAARTADEAH